MKHTIKLETKIIRRIIIIKVFNRFISFVLFGFLTIEEHMKNNIRLIATLLIIVFLVYSCVKQVPETKIKTGNVILIHPDGAGLSAWNALRILDKGPDGETNWDKLPNIGLYKSHTENSLTTSSNAGATMHSFGQKVPYHSYGMNGNNKLTALSGEDKSILIEARDAGIATGIINSGSIVEPGTGVFAASDERRDHYEEITKKIIESGVDLIMSGGEEWMLPEGVYGRHGYGKRTDGLNLIHIARDKGYEVVYTLEEMKNIPFDTKKLLGVFALSATFNDKTEEELKKLGLPNYNPEAPTIAEMTETAIRVLKNTGKQFFLVVEEEGTDNFPNHNNANGTFEALKRADDAIGVALEFQQKEQNTLVLVTSDSEAGGMEICGYRYQDVDDNFITPEKESNGAPVDGSEGTKSRPFFSKEDQFGRKLPFHVAWSTLNDTYGSVVVKAIGVNSYLSNGLIDNTDIYRIMYASLFGKLLDK
ncbi:MAG: alkaline phosphatase [Ignavibacteriae bacterium HGW-Ignavibacteriae-2]|nr:MAG: alkaline phosphatase [Ignavibacteriae bacterium HGW-Ignavibacteriae-2]